MTSKLRRLLTRLRRYLANPGRIVGGGAVRDPLSLAAVEEERRAGPSRQSGDQG
jgi:hypothetical protein